MKIFLSADMEGTAGITAWSETEPQHADYAAFRVLMTDEVVAACEGARQAGATTIVVKDAHDSGRNLLVDRLPPDVTIVRGWAGHPDGMMFGIDGSFDAALHTGCHARAGAEGNPLAHTTTTRIAGVMLNGAPASEFRLNALCAARYGVPSRFISGDRDICAEARALVPGIDAVETMTGTGFATTSLVPARATALIRETVARALSRPVEGCFPPGADEYELVVEFRSPNDAYRVQWYPGACLHGPCRVAFAARDYFEIQRAYMFLTR
ncbi:M55 family metallopeptidase [Novacetimonas pomaceti]|uniref:Peptide ABC transporter n=1 Tax=Novacetimonas pomaceti TaxID=2021998 RepID=A0ABX5P8E1_9PROT|nr:M55 family metallopeptidase [Novacetimonas pomaceti]MBV1832736.1 M55 family metallopeptidase [Novacetimonas pomaceti]PYD49023.1 peptide ABC transporter [Novacetimonas pomaceti]